MEEKEPHLHDDSQLPLKTWRQRWFVLCPVPGVVRLASGLWWGVSWWWRGWVLGQSGKQPARLRVNWKQWEREERLSPNSPLQGTSQ